MVWTRGPDISIVMLDSLKRISRRIPVLGVVAVRLRDRYRYRGVKRLSLDEVFGNIFRHKTWGGISASGTGSDLTQTARIASVLPALFKAYEVSSVLDIPCGDFYWMSKVDLQRFRYIGADIVGDLIQGNRRYQATNITFERMDLLTTPLPHVDLVLCRDCLVHMSFRDIFSALRNICESGSRYLLTTTFPVREYNDDILTGQWRTLNLERRPFQFPKPLEIIQEGCTEKNREYADKSLGLWKISDLRASVTGSQTKRVPEWLSKVRRTRDIVSA